MLAACGAASPSDVEDSEATPVAAVTEALSTNALTPAEAKTTLKLVDDICGDTWCDGDYDFHFRRLTCNGPAETCTLVFQVIPRDGVASPRPLFGRSCKTHGFTGFDSLVTTAPNGYQSLDQSYYDELTECVSRIEEKL